jgi:DNA-binding transcriptional MerR regulator
MSRYSISEAGARSGFAASTLRYYEQVGLVTPERTESGYRSYDDQQIDTLHFIGRAKGFGLSLDEITEVLTLLEGERCAPVQDRLRDLVDRKISDSQARVAELVAFTAELQRVAAMLTSHTPDGPCDASCGCGADGPNEGHEWAGVALVSSAAQHDPPVACTLAPDQMNDRVADWHSVIRTAERRERHDDGVRLHFGSGVDVGAIAVLANAEQQCCQFFMFRLTFSSTGVTLDISGPEEAQPVIDALVSPHA